MLQTIGLCSGSPHRTMFSEARLNRVCTWCQVYVYSLRRLSLGHCTVSPLSGSNLFNSHYLRKNRAFKYLARTGKRAFSMISRQTEDASEARVSSELVREGRGKDLGFARSIQLTEDFIPWPSPVPNRSSGSGLHEGDR